MRITLITFVSVCNFLVTVPVAGQASFWLNTWNVSAPVFDAQGNPLEGTDYLAELWGGSVSNSLNPAVTYYTSQRVMVPFTFAPGYVLDGYMGRDSADDLVVFDVAPGPTIRDWAWLQVRAWDARLGGTYEEVEALGVGGYGESRSFFAQGGVPGQLLPDLPGELIGLQFFNLRPIIPEPSTGALLALGGAMLLTGRKRVGPGNGIPRPTPSRGPDSLVS
jgi:hypothetical protein